MPVTYRSHLRIGSACVRIEWDAGMPESFARLLYAPWHTDDSEPPDHTISVTRTDGVYRIESPSGELSATDSGPAMAHLEYSLTLLAQELLSDHLQIHASCFGNGDRSVLAVGGHGSGKTTLALTAISSGLQALSDDICLIGDDNRRLYGFPRPFKATDDTWRMSPRPVPADCPFQYAVPDITYVFFHEPAGEYYRAESELAHLLFPVRGEGDTRLIPLGETAALELLLRQGFNYIRLGERDTVQRLLSLIRNAPSYELRYSDHWDAIRAIRELLES